MDGKDFNKLTAEYTKKYLNDIQTFKSHLNDLEDSYLEAVKINLNNLPVDPESFKNNPTPVPQWQKLALMSAANYDNLSENEQIRLLALIGDVESEIILGSIYLNNHKLIDYKKAFYWSSIAALKDSPVAFYNLGMTYYFGYGPPQSYKHALYLFNKSIDLGLDKKLNKNKDWDFIDPKTFIGCIYEIGDGVEQDFKLAFDYFSIAAENGDAVAQYHLGRFYEHGIGLNQDRYKAVKFFEKSALQGYDVAQHYIGYLYDSGIVNPQNNEETNIKIALGWFAKAANQGHLDSINQLGLVNEYGRGTPQNYEMAYNFYLDAASKGLAIAQTNIAKLYIHGNGVAQNYKTAAKWLEKATNQNCHEAQLALGIMNLEGLYFKQSKQKAAVWINLSRKNGNEQAEELWNKDELWKYEQNN